MEKCVAVADIGFMLDSSHSMNTHWNDGKKFIKNVMSAFELGEDKIRASVMRFSSARAGPFLDIKFNSHYNKSDFNAVIDTMKLVSSYGI